jgi:hypothetical protein
MTYLIAFFLNYISPKLNILGNQDKTFPASEPLKISQHFYFVLMHLHVLW